MPYKIAFVSLGCAKNLVNTEQMMALCRKAGHTITGEPEGADVAVLNTCGFIESAKSEAIDNILQLGRLKEEGKLKKLLVAGCLTQRYPDDIRKRKSHILQRRNAADCREVILSVISVIGESVGFGKLEKPDLGVAAQHSDADPGQL